MLKAWALFGFVWLGLALAWLALMVATGRPLWQELLAGLWNVPLSAYAAATGLRTLRGARAAEASRLTIADVANALAVGAVDRAGALELAERLGYDRAAARAILNGGAERA